MPVELELQIVLQIECIKKEDRRISRISKKKMEIMKTA